MDQRSQSKSLKYKTLRRKQDKSFRMVAMISWVAHQRYRQQQQQKIDKLDFRKCLKIVYRQTLLTE
jgi:hypothetical protein